MSDSSHRSERAGRGAVTAVSRAVLGWLILPFYLGIPIFSSHSFGLQSEYSRVSVEGTSDKSKVSGGVGQVPKAFPGQEGFDRLIPQLMSKWNIPGGAIAIAKGDKLVFATAYGLANKEQAQPVQPDSLFRIASVSKPFTAVGILKLMEEGKLSVDDQAFRILGDRYSSPKDKADPRLQTITIRQLLFHSGGWDAGKSRDPMGDSREVAHSLGVPLPVSSSDMIRYVAGHKLDFDPGTRHAYSNFGYCLLGRVIERVSGESYEEYIRTHLLKPIGITRMRIGRTLREQRSPGEVCYYPAAGVPPARSAIRPGGPGVSLPYGGFYLEAMDSHGGWIASAIDLVRFLLSVEGNGNRAGLLKPETIALMTERPSPPLWVNTPIYYGMGWNFRPVKGGLIWYHSGALAGSSMAMVVKSPNGFSWAVLFNSIPPSISEIEPFFMELDQTIWKAMHQVTQWPDLDLFPRYPWHFFVPGMNVRQFGSIPFVEL